MTATATGSALLVPFGRQGHTLPMAAVGTTLRELGWDVSLLIEPKAAGQLTGAGLPLVTPRRWRSDAPVPVKVHTAGDTGAVFRHLSLGSVVDHVSDVEEAVAAVGADVVVGDVFMPGAGLAAERLGTPWASVACGPIPELDTYRVFIDEQLLDCFDAATTRAELGLPARPENLLGRVSPYLHLIPTTPAFAGHPSLPETVRLVGPFVPAPRRPARPRSATPLVVAVASSEAWVRRGDGARRQRRYLANVVEAMAGVDIGGRQVSAVVVNPTGAPGAGSPPPNVRLTGLLPESELNALFDECAAVVTHGGWGTTCKALLRGLPVVVMPTSIDQHYVARRCDELGLGLAVDPMTATVGEIREAVRAVCHDPSYRRTAERVAADLRAADSLRTAASLIAAIRAEPAAVSPSCPSTAPLLTKE